MSAGTVSPKYVHDCDKCRFVGIFNHPDRGLVDLYVHDRPEPVGDDWIYRWGNAGWEYGCFPREAGMAHARQHPEGVYAAIGTIERAFMTYAQDDLAQRLIRGNVHYLGDFDPVVLWDHLPPPPLPAKRSWLFRHRWKVGFGVAVLGLLWAGTQDERAAGGSPTLEPVGTTVPALWVDDAPTTSESVPETIIEPDEDSSEWDCRIHGNGLCGPAPEAWTTVDDQMVTVRVYTQVSSSNGDVRACIVWDSDDREVHTCRYSDGRVDDTVILK